MSVHQGNQTGRLMDSLIMDSSTESPLRDLKSSTRQTSLDRAACTRPAGRPPPRRPIVLRFDVKNDLSSFRFYAARVLVLLAHHWRNDSRSNAGQAPDN